jgi:SAM-dependent methyltransferase
MNFNIIKKKNIIKKTKKFLKRNKYIYGGFSLIKPFSDFFRFRPISFLNKYFWFLLQFIKYKNLKCNPHFNFFTFYPCLFDNTNYTCIEPIYLLQDIWFVHNLFKNKPNLHYDIGSSFKTISIIAQFTNVVFIDIRPPNIKVPNVIFIKGDITNLPFPDSSIQSLSSLCVIEHIGLGRYGDKLNPFGSEKAIKELKRVCSPGGLIYISLHVDSYNKIYFNAHRAFTRDYIMELFEGFEILDEKYIYGTRLWEEYDKDKGFGTGLYLFLKKGGN